MVIDTDGGPDDSAAILLTLSAFAQEVSDYEVVGITCVYGNTYENNVKINILKTLTVANSTHVSFLLLNIIKIFEKYPSTFFNIIL